MLCQFHLGINLQEGLKVKDRWRVHHNSSARFEFTTHFCVTTDSPFSVSSTTILAIGNTLSCFSIKNAESEYCFILLCNKTDVYKPTSHIMCHCVGFRPKWKYCLPKIKDGEMIVIISPFDVCNNITVL